MSRGGRQAARRRGVAAGEYCRQPFRGHVPLGRRSCHPVRKGYGVRQRRSYPASGFPGSVLHGHPPMTDTCDAVVIGAGIVGAATAAAMAAAGMRVTVVESAAVGGGATAAGM